MQLERIYKEKRKDCPLQPASIHLSSYTGDAIPVLGQIQVPVRYEEKEWTLPLIIVKVEKAALLGRNWLQKIKLNWGEIFSLRNDKPEAVEKELDCLQKNNIITKVERSDWAAPIVVVPKKDNTVRMCGDYKITVNHCILPEEYPLPNAEDLFATLAGGKIFSKLDLSFAYQQLKLDPESEQYLTINKHKGLFRFNRLAYGISTAPAIFQHRMDQISDGIDNVVCFMDDILVSAPTIEEHLVVLDKVMSRLEKNGGRMKRCKCKFLQDSVEYLGYKIDEQGLHPTNSKVEAIVNAPAPTNVSELRSFLGLLNYYGKFVANLSSLLHPLHQLLQADTKWNWSPPTETCQENKTNNDCGHTGETEPDLPPNLAHHRKPMRSGDILFDSEGHLKSLTSDYCECSKYGQCCQTRPLRLADGKGRLRHFATESLNPPVRNNVPQRVDTVGAGEPLQCTAVHTTKSRGTITKPCCRTWTKQTHAGRRCSGG
ncbi:hypothetical protein J4Q44_G00089210 [Coregonus suidteri]|uniref:ribonuclease H n=1 Tax=Coregonus suidteri TaxID=861788 RepID=A0AAN8M0J8_9TELE